MCIWPKVCFDVKWKQLLDLEIENEGPSLIFIYQLHDTGCPRNLPVPLFILLSIRTKIQGWFFSQVAMWPLVNSIYLKTYWDIGIAFKKLCSRCLSRINGRSHVPYLCSSLGISPLCPVGTSVSMTHTLLSFTNLSENGFTSSSWPPGLSHLSRYLSSALSHDGEASEWSKKLLWPLGQYLGSTHARVCQKIHSVT